MGNRGRTEGSTVFLTSSPIREYGPDCQRPELYPDNRFVELLGERWPDRGRCLMIAAFPDAHSHNDEMTAVYREAVEHAEFPVSRFDLWDDRIPALTDLEDYDVVFLAGGHVTKEGRWFEEIGLQGLLEGWNGLIIGTSAGSMNAARLVYAWPEEPGESYRPPEELFYPGLGLTETVILPHLNKLAHARLDGRLLVEEIARDHSWGHRFLAIPDGSFVLAENGEARVYGQALLVADGEIVSICRIGECRSLTVKKREEE